MNRESQTRAVVIGAVSIIALGGLLWWFYTPRASRPVVQSRQEAGPLQKSPPPAPPKAPQSPAVVAALEKILSSKPGHIDRIAAQAALQQLIDEGRMDPALVSYLIGSSDTRLQLLAVRLNLEANRPSFDRDFAIRIAGMDKVELQAELSSWLWNGGLLKEHGWFMEQCQRAAVGAPNQQWSLLLQSLIASSSGPPEETNPALEILEIGRNTPHHIEQVIRSGGTALQAEVISTLTDPLQSFDVRMLVLDSILKNPFPGVFDRLLTIVPRATDPGYAAYIARALGKLGYGSDNLAAVAALGQSVAIPLPPSVIARTAEAIAEKNRKLTILLGQISQPPATGNTVNGAVLWDLVTRLRNTNYTAASTPHLVLIVERLRTEPMNRLGLDHMRSLEVEILRRGSK